MLQELEDKILRLLKEAKGNILDDELLINTLNNSKLTAGMIQNRVREAEETEDSINQVCCSWHMVNSRLPIPAQYPDSTLSPRLFDALLLLFCHSLKRLVSTCLALVAAPCNYRRPKIHEWKVMLHAMFRLAAAV